VPGDLRVAIVGYGLAGSVFHAPLVAATPGLSVATVVTSNAARQDEVRTDHPSAQVVASSDELFARADEHDLVVVASPNSSHAPLAHAALDAGLPVVVDKPLAVSASEARALIEHAASVGVMLTAFHNRRWDSDHLTLRRLIGAGELGEVTRFESRFERWRPEAREEAWRDTTPPEQGGGVLLDLGPHLIDQALTLFGPAVSVHGEVDARRGGAADDDAFVAIEHESGVYSHLWMSAVVAAPGPRLRVLGTRAAFVVDALDSQEDALRRGERPGPDWGIEPRSAWGALWHGEPPGRPVPSERGAWPELYAGVERSLRDGAPPPVDARDALAALEVIEAARGR
jgi:scyllo-inositol 2-dehydrogenase (NADP+)